MLKQINLLSLNLLQTPMNWIPLTSLEQLASIANAPGFKIIFKHSTRCPVSSMAKRQFELEQDLIPKNTAVYLLDLIAFRSISNEIASIWNVKHESPQVLLIKDNSCIYHTSHHDIEAAQLVLTMES